MKTSLLSVILLWFSLLSVNAQVINSNTNVGVGSNVLSKNTTGYRNISLGDYSLNMNTTGFSNNALGYKAMFSNISGDFNTAIGSFALYLNQTGYQNVGIGHKSLYSNISGANNVALGYQSMYYNTTGRDNTALGNKALLNNTQGIFNTAVGWGALAGNRSGNRNSALGRGALSSVTTGYENTAVGYYTGSGLTTGIRNNILGSWTTLSGTSSYNILMGYRTASYGDNNIIIGKKIALPQGTSNAMNIGGVLFGSGFHSDLPEDPATGPANGRIGINVVNPTATLDINGNMKVSDNLLLQNDLILGAAPTPVGSYGKRLYFGSSEDNFDEIFMARYNVASDQSELRINVGDDRGDKFVVGRKRWDQQDFEAMFMVKTDGNVGIGVTDPKSKLHVEGDILLPVGYSITANPLSNDKFIHDGKEMGNYAIKWVRDTWSGKYTSAAVGPTLWLSGFSGIKLMTGLQSRLSVTGDGNVGIGIEIPKSKLDVNGTIRAKEVKIELTNWPDYVFDPSYDLPSLKEVESHIQAHKHLPGIPSQTQVETEGIDLGALNTKLLEKIEELTLYVIQQGKEIESLRDEVKQLKK